MKPLKSFLFFLGLLAAVVATDFGYRAVTGHRGIFSFETPRLLKSGFSPTRHRQWKVKWSKEPEDGETLNLQQVWAQDELMTLYKEIYKPDADIFSDPRLSDIPLIPFSFDTSQTARRLLDDFFVKLLILRRPEHDRTLRYWYAHPDFWDEPLADNRANFYRILHFGDSQIENDRITGTLRSLFQAHFGGHGPGLLPLFQSYKSPAKPEIAGAWHIVKADKNSRKGNFGIYNAHLTSPPMSNLLIRSKKKKETGVIKYTVPSGICGANTVFDLVLHTDINPGQIKLTWDGKTAAEPAVLESFNQQRFTYGLPSSTRNMVLETDITKKNRSIYALAINDTVGLSVDNLPSRGNAGTVFTPNNRRFLTDQLNLLNTGLIIYQFGANALKPAAGKQPAGKQPAAKNYNYYRMLLMQELSYIRTQMPSVPVIVIGVGNNIRAQGDAQTVREIQRETAFQTGCIYWDWAEADNLLSYSDGVHLTDKGAEKAAQLFYKAFLDSYRNFLIRERKEAMMARAKQLQEEIGKGGRP